MTATAESIHIAGIAARAASDKLAEDILVIDVSQRLAITDCFVVASGDNERQVNAIVDEVEDQLSDEGFKPTRREGRGEGHWVLLDYGSIVVHVQRKQEREFYALDRLWADAPQIEVEGVEQVERSEVWSDDTSIDILDATSVDDLPLAGPTPDTDEL
ncbi:ribosome silencing factor [Corynebacterium sp. 320]|uniref:Ribosomal silencing factor RsfS n=1 Tax=Corynebacterium zhongnanshanii TaxID=2768834 RepID=A0ABQ6VDD9_9CORY|nr:MULTISPECIES: ribosome silencing factor [Corynebacterium]KAB1502385.1 ribosome silencing factor [Corynebacterium sp. 320]KAB1551393.1 ribosome silencing factor [Corynebacterium sp. 321]KAB1551778.1 ribosome silencing factor [Corynebacterium sp. 319]KAB3520935.1 ribosome silencing factor [Corynebacterium zhongnanshanii]KAB3525992.1 ribosome silencing factor [Corynebacterium sp. 250]